MSILDQPDRWESADPKSMRTLIKEFPAQVRAAASSEFSLDARMGENIDAIVVTGLGGSAIGGDLAKSIAGERLRKPYIINRDYMLPGFVGKTTLVFACSYSGNTEETLSSYNRAKSENAKIVCITSGGELENRAVRDGYPLLSMPKGLPPRAALGFSLFSLLGAMQDLRLVPDLKESIEETATLLDTLARNYGPENPESENDAKKLAQSLHGRIVAIYGSSALLDTTALRWRAQIEENAKTLAFHHALPEMNHNELVGWMCPEEALRQVAVIMLRDREDHPQVQRRFELTKEIIAAKTSVLHEHWTMGESPLARVMSLVYLGDFVSLYLAYLNEMDPTPVKVIDYLKSKLSEEDGEGRH